jgi:SulP family sulfate permease
MKWRQYLPILDWLPTYTHAQFRGDLGAGLTVGIILIPQGMAYAMLAGLPPIHGLYAATLPLILYSIFGTSRQLSVAPEAIGSILTASAIGSMAAQGSNHYLQMSFALALMVGVLRLLLGLLRLGFIVNFLSHPVIRGFTSAAAIVIAVTQLKSLFGVKIPNSERIHEIVWALFQQINHLHGLTLGIGLVAIIILWSIKKISPRFPGSLLVLALGILVVWIFKLDQQGVIILGSVPEGLPAFLIPKVAWQQEFRQLWPFTVTIALVGFMESIALAKSVRAHHLEYKVEANQELIALGLANIGAGLFQGFPVNGGISRTAINDQAGAQTGMASIISAATVVLTLLFLTPLFHYLPNAILAAIILFSAINMVKIQEPRELWKSNKTDFWMLMATFVVTLTLGIQDGIATGVMVSLAMMIFKSTRPHYALLGQIPDTHIFRNVLRFKDLVQRPEVLIFRYDADLYFANISHFMEILEAQVQAKSPSIRFVIVDAESINNLDSTAIEGLLELVESFKQLGIKLVFSSLKGPIRDAIKKAQLVEKIGESHFYINIIEAIAAFENLSSPLHHDYAIQSNVD